MRKLSMLSTLLFLASCSSPPKPATVDPSSRHPVNASAQVDAQICRNELYNARLQAIESGRLAASTSATLNNLVARQRTLLALQEIETRSASANGVYTVRFDFGSVRVEIPDDEAQALIAQAKSVPLVLLRGRTDGTTDSLAQSRIARERALAVRDYLVAAGLDPARIRTTYQPIGDPVAENATSVGRSLNRRVEIELYHSLPIALNAASAMP